MRRFPALERIVTFFRISGKSVSGNISMTP
jgi:hypothetical protein